MSPLITGPVEVIGCHAAGEIGDVIVGGVAPPPGDTIWQQSRAIFDDQRLRQFLLNEPRGGVFKHVNLLVPPIDPAADIGFIIMEPEDNPPMSGSNSICVATVVLETGIVEMREPTTTLRMEAPGGVVEAVATCRDGKVVDVTVRNVPAFVAAQNLTLHLDRTLTPSLPDTIRVDTAFGGDSFVMVDAADLDIELVPSNGHLLAKVGQHITDAANAQLSFEHPTTEWTHFSFCQIAGPLQRIDAATSTMRNTVVIKPGKLDRSPTGTGLSARMALLHAQQKMAVGDQLRMRSIIDSEFVGTIERETTEPSPGIIPLITGSAWRTGSYRYELDASDPWPLGYRVSDTWPDSSPR